METMFFVLKMFVCYLFSDGMSRSGVHVFITCMSEIERVKFEGGLDIFQTVKAAREQRPHMVYTSGSYCQNLQIILFVINNCKCTFINWPECLKLSN